MTGNVPAPDVVLFDLDTDDKWQALSRIVRPFENHSHVVNLAEWESDLIRREKLQPAMMAAGVAFPHVRTNAVDRIVWALASSRKGISFQPDTAPVHLVVMIGIPEQMVREYLDFIGTLAEMLRGSAAIESLVSANSEAQIRERFLDLSTKRKQGTEK